MDRASFLRLAGAGVGLSVLPAYLAAFGSASSALTTGDTGIAGGEFPIGVWWPPPPAETTAERYAEIRGAGFNFVIGGNGVNDDATNPAALDAAAANGLGFLLTDRTLHRIIRDGAASAAGTSTRTARDRRGARPSVMRVLLAQDGASSQAVSDPGETVGDRVRELLALYGDHPALAGLNVYDEPHRDAFGLVARAREVMQGSAPAELPYVNTWPSYASAGALGTATYEAYLDEYMRSVAPPVLSFNHYPLLESGITADYFHNWAEIRRRALGAGVPSWGFIQSAGFGGGGLAQRRRPNERELLWQANVGLAYGAKGIQYFTYWTPDPPPEAPIQFGQALISGDGQRTSLYEAAGRVNAYLRVIGPRLLPLVSESVAHAGEKNPPYGARVFGKDGYVKSRSGSPVILGRFRNPAGGTDRHLLVVNRSNREEANARLELAARVDKVYEVDRATGGNVRVRLSGRPPRYLRVRLAPGAARLYVLRTG